jgi:hypothetical protein
MITNEQLAARASRFIWAAGGSMARIAKCEDLAERLNAYDGDNWFEDICDATITGGAHGYDLLGYGQEADGAIHVVSYSESRSEWYVGTLTGEWTVEGDAIVYGGTR